LTRSQPLSSAPPPEPDELDHVRGDGPRVIVYGDYECPFCAKLHFELREEHVTVVFRHFPVPSKHPRSEVLAQAAEAVSLQGRFWEFHDSLYSDQGRLDIPHLWERCERLGLDLERFEADRRSSGVAERVQRDFRSGVRAGVTSTPGTFGSADRSAGSPPIV
jgi:protein-disulfide isomerase